MLALGERAARESYGAFATRLPGPDGRERLDPSGVVKGWAVERAARGLRAPGRHGLRPLRRRRHGGAARSTRPRPPGGSASRTRTIPVGCSPCCPVHTGAVATSGTAHRGAHLVDARTGLAPRGVASVSVVASSLTWADIDATAAYALGPDAADWLRTRPGRTALVVWADGTTTSLAVPDRIGVRRCAASPPAARAC